MEKLREELYEIIAANVSLCNEGVVKVSRELDKLIYFITNMIKKEVKNKTASSST